MGNGVLLTGDWPLSGLMAIGDMSMRANTPFWKSLAAVVVAAFIGTLLAVVPVAANAASWEDQLPREDWPEPVSADALPTVQIGNGVIWSVEVSGNTGFAVGEFTTARPAGAAPGVSEQPRGNFLAFNVATGELLPFAPTFNAAVKDVAVTSRLHFLRSMSNPYFF